MVERDHERWTGTRSEVQGEAQFGYNALMASDGTVSENWYLDSGAI